MIIAKQCLTTKCVSKLHWRGTAMSHFQQKGRTFLNVSFVSVFVVVLNWQPGYWTANDGFSSQLSYWSAWHIVGTWKILLESWMQSGKSGFIVDGEMIPKSVSGIHAMYSGCPYIVSQGLEAKGTFPYTVCCIYKTWK